MTQILQTFSIGLYSGIFRHTFRKVRSDKYGNGDGEDCLVGRLINAFNDINNF